MRLLLGLSFLLLFCTNSWGSNNSLRELMSPICESLGTNEGAQCVELQRKMGRESTYLDSNGASICALTWRWSSRSGDSAAAGRLVLSCFEKVGNRKISDEVKATCNRSVYESQGSIASIEIVTKKINKMMTCIKEISIPVKK
jgi:hypothetical protein